MSNEEIKRKIKDALVGFASGNLTANAIRLFSTLGYASEKRLLQTAYSPEEFLNSFNRTVARPLNPSKALVDSWKQVAFLFQLTADEIKTGSQLGLDFGSEKKVDTTIMESYLFFALELVDRDYTRTELAVITREINKIFGMPVMILFRHGDTVTLAIIDRRLNKRDDTQDVLEKVTLIKDIIFASPHRAHIEILFDLSSNELQRQFGFTNFVELHRAWQKALDSSELNKKFFKELSNWYFLALQNVAFPKGAGADVELRNATSVIRLITRLIFIWFIKEKGLVPDELFNQGKLQSILKYNDPEESTYYKAILQNLFFATLNQEMNTLKEPNNRQFRARSKHPDGRDQHFGITNLYRYKDYFQNPTEAIRLFSSIPFLNGGLFECLDKPRKDAPTRIIRIDGFSDHKDNEIRVPDFLFFSNEREVDLSKAYGVKNRVEKVRGLINILERYKFTINENTPIEEEVALDPELLGKVFENLLASYNPETQTTARKATGSYYTPRDIVNYMVNESLIAYLTASLKEKMPELAKTDGLEDVLHEVFAYKEKEHYFNAAETTVLIDAIDNVKVLDPACGSGAFPMGILHKLVFILGKLDPHNKLWKERQLANAAKIEDPFEHDNVITGIEDSFERNEMDYGRKLFLIQNCIYGVDIQPVASQIAKLRFFISLVVDQKLDEQRENRGILPLPNLETKFVAANTLIGLDKPKLGQKLILRNPEIVQKESELDSVRQRYFTARTQKTKQKYKDKDARLRAQLSVLLVRDGFAGETALKVASWDPYDQNIHAEWFDPEWMFGVSEFDVVIANPPYIKEYINREAFDGVRASSYYQGKMDIWYLFACQSIDHLKSNGILTFIAQNNWVTSHGASKLRNKVISDTRILALLDFGDFKIFDTSGIQTMVMVFRKDSQTDNYKFDYRRVLGDTVSFEDIVDLLNLGINPANKYLLPIISRSKLNDKTLTFSPSATDSVIRAIEKKANFHFDAEKEVAQGIVYPQDKLNLKNNDILGGRFEVGNGIFVLSEKEKQNLPFFRNELGLLKPSYTTKELHKWYGEPKNKEWVIYTDSSFKHPSSIKPYPNIKAHLDKFRKVITSDNWPYGLHRARDERFFKGEKVIAVRKCAEPAFTYTDFDCYVSATFYVIKTERVNLKYLTAILNSKLVAFWLRNKGKMQGNNYQIDKEPLLAIPIYKPSNQAQQSVTCFVDQLLFTTKVDDFTANPATQAKIKELEAKIDQLVYQLYGLTPEEIAVVEGR